MTKLTEWADNVLRTSDGREKTRISRIYAAEWFALRDKGELPEIGRVSPPERPARPARPELLAPRDMPRRRPGTLKGRLALLHAVAHIELNAVDLHWDMIARFGHLDWPAGFYDDWVRAADDESKHFNLMSDCLEDLGSFYGDLPAHAQMWRAAEETKDDVLARLAVVPMVLEARGLDVTPGMIDIFRRAEHKKSVEALEVIYSEEVSHVAYGTRWFHFLCGRDGLDPKPTFHGLVRKYFHTNLKPPFNEEKRAEAGLSPDFYWPLAEDMPLPAALR